MVHELYNQPPSIYSLPKVIKFWHFRTSLYHSHLLLLSIFQHVDVQKHTPRMTVKPFEACVSVCMLSSCLEIHRLSLCSPGSPGAPRSVCLSLLSLALKVCASTQAHFILKSVPFQLPESRNWPLNTVMEPDGIYSDFRLAPVVSLAHVLSTLESGPLVVLMWGHLLAFRVCRLPSTKGRLFSLLYIFSDSSFVVSEL